MPVKSKKSLKDVEEHVRKWQASQEQDDSFMMVEDNGWNADVEDQGEGVSEMDMDMDANTTLRAALCG